MTHTKDKLADALEKAGLPEMAAKAREGWYHDFLSPLTFPDLQLAEDLLAAIQKGNLAADELFVRHMNGEFDASKEEADAWALSPAGRAAYDQLSPEMRLAFSDPRMKN